MVYLYNNHCIVTTRSFFAYIYLITIHSGLIFKNQRTRKYDNSSKIQFY